MSYLHQYAQFDDLLHPLGLQAHPDRDANPRIFERQNYPVIASGLPRSPSMNVVLTAALRGEAFAHIEQQRTGYSPMGPEGEGLGGWLTAFTTTKRYPDVDSALIATLKELRKWV